MIVKSKVSKFTGNRKIIELPKSVRDNFKVGEEINIKVTKNGTSKLIRPIRKCRKVQSNN